MADNLFGKKELSMADKTKISRNQTNQLTRKVIDWLNDSGQFRAHRSSNAPGTRLANEEKQITGKLPNGDIVTITAIIPVVYHKKNQMEFAILDISGFRLSDSVHLEIEVKTKTDTLSKEQAERIADIKANNGISFVFDTFETFLLQIKKYLVSNQAF